MKPQQQTIQLAQHQGLVSLYDKYSAMLLGYIYEIVNDHELAEQYMISVFKTVADQYHEFQHDNINWSSLQQLAKCKLTDFSKAVKDCDYTMTLLNTSQNGLISQMNKDQRNIFCAIYYHGKTIAFLATELNQSELIIRKTLKEAFAIIRKGRGN